MNVGSMQWGNTQLDMVKVVGNVLNGRMHALEKRMDKDKGKMVKKMYQSLSIKRWTIPMNGQDK